MGKKKRLGTPITARDIEALNARRDELERPKASVRDDLWREVWEVLRTMTLEEQQRVLRFTRFLVHESRTHPAGGNVLH